MVLPPSHQLKLAWAQDHLQQLSQAIGQWLASNPYGIQTALPAPNHVQIVATHDATPPPLFPLMIGDLAHQYRCCLDHLAYSLAESHTGTLTDKQEQQSQFPIYDTEKAFTDWREKRIGACSPQA